MACMASYIAIENSDIDTAQYQEVLVLGYINTYNSISKILHMKFLVSSLKEHYNIRPLLQKKMQSHLLELISFAIILLRLLLLLRSF
jgi:hypothetical protein